MRIAIVVRSLKIGGMERAAINLAEAFESNKHEAHLIYFRNKGKKLTPNKNVYLHHFDLDKIMKLTIIGFFWNLFAKLMSMLIRESYFFWKGLFVTPIFKWKLHLLEKQYGKFDLIIIRGHGTFELLWPYYDSRAVQQQVSIAFKYTNALRRFYLGCLYDKKSVLCISSGIKDELDKAIKYGHIEPSRIEVITNPVNIPLIQEKANEYMPDITSNYIVNVGRFTKGKNIPLLLEAFAYAHFNLHLTHKLIIIGDGDLREMIESTITSLNIQDSVILTGSIDNPFPWVKHADLFVFTSFAEGLGNVLLEALACKTNIVSTKGKGGIQDIMRGEFAEHLCNFDKVELAEKIVSELNRIKPIDFETALKPFTPKGIIDQYVETYETI